MTQTTDRNAIDVLTLAFAVDAWMHGDHRDSDEADIDLEAVMLDQGVINPGEVIHEFIPRTMVGAIRVVLDDGTEFDMTTDGQVI